MNCPVCQQLMTMIDNWPKGQIFRCTTGHFQRTMDRVTEPVAVGGSR